MTATRYRRASHARESAAAIPMISLAFLTTWGQSDASGCRTINHWQLGARKPYGARLFGVFALVQMGFKFPFGERRSEAHQRRAADRTDRAIDGGMRRASRDEHRSDRPADRGVLLCRGLLSASSSWLQSGRRRNAHRIPKEERRDFP